MVYYLDSCSLHMVEALFRTYYVVLSMDQPWGADETSASPVNSLGQLRDALRSVDWNMLSVDCLYTVLQMVDRADHSNLEHQVVNSQDILLEVQEVSLATQLADYG